MSHQKPPSIVKISQVPALQYVTAEFIVTGGVAVLLVGRLTCDF